MAAPDALESSPPALPRLAHLPVAVFAVAMGLAGLTLATHAAERALGLGGALSAAALAATLGLLVLLLALYGWKLATAPAAVAEEWRHPVKIAFFPAVSISLLLAATAIAPRAPEIARPLWLFGAALQGGLTLAVLAAWIGHRAFQPVQMSPAWFIPAVGNVVAPIAGAGLGFVELSWLFFSGGLVFWLVLMTLVVNRLVFHDPLPGRLAPTLAILVAPPAVAFLAYRELGGGIDPFARVLLNAGYVFALVVATQAPKLARLPFALSFWALTFPVAALATASLVYAEAAGSQAHRAIGLGLWAALVLAVGALGARTLGAVARREICRPDA